MDIAHDLLEARLVASFATLDRDGSVHLVGMWFVWDGEAVLLPTSGTTRKVRNLERDARATVMIDDSRAGLDLRGIVLAGRVSILRGAEAVLLNRRIHLKYLTESGRELPPVDRYLATDDVTIRLAPERTSSWDLRNTEQGRALAETGESRPLD